MSTKKTNPAKVRKAAADPKRPGEACLAPAGKWVPVIDRDRCEGKADCEEVCPYNVFEVGQLTDTDYRALPFGLRIKARLHGKKTVYTPHADACQACGLCVVACPERAITLVAVA
ncbi:MAG: ferredoxin family protein [Gammaproteobacteria bacterium]|nr:ferredoxin family protein [Gammaproteobacteria bacterium]